MFYGVSQSSPAELRSKLQSPKMVSGLTPHPLPTSSHIPTPRPVFPETTSQINHLFQIFISGHASGKIQPKTNMNVNKPRIIEFKTEMNVCLDFKPHVVETMSCLCIFTSQVGVSTE